MAGGRGAVATIGRTMGQSIVVNEKPSSNPGVVRFETNRALTGMGHERYLAGTEVWGDRPPDELARRLLARGGVAGVQINGNVVTVDLEKGFQADGLRSIIENLYRFYPDQPATAGDDTRAAAPLPEAADAPEEAADPADATPATAEDAPAPDHPTDAAAAATAPRDEPVPAGEVAAATAAAAPTDEPATVEPEPEPTASESTESESAASDAAADPA